MPLGEFDECHPMSQRCRLSLEGPNDPSPKSSYRESHGIQYIMKKRVMFLAVTAAPRANQFCPNRRRIEIHGTAKERIESLEGDVSYMTRIKLAQHCETRLAWPRVADAGEICGKINVSVHRATIHLGVDRKPSAFRAWIFPAGDVQKSRLSTNENRPK